MKMIYVTYHIVYLNTETRFSKTMTDLKNYVLKPQKDAR